MSNPNIDPKWIWVGAAAVALAAGSAREASRAAISALRARSVPASKVGRKDRT